jgi:hypothetical protein
MKPSILSLNEEMEKSEFIKRLISFIEKADDVKKRIHALDYLNSRNWQENCRDSFRILEECTISDQNEIVRAMSAECLARRFKKKAIPILGWVLKNDTSALVLKTIQKLAKKIDTYQSPSLHDIYLKRIAEIRHNKNIGLNAIEFLIEFGIDLNFKLYPSIGGNSYIIYANDLCCILKKGKIQSLSISNRKIIPSSIHKLLNLKNLNLSFNEFENFEVPLQKFKYLKTINLSWNNLIEIPKTLRSLPSNFNLNLNLSHNKIQRFLDWCCAYLNLGSLDLSNNHIRKLPRKIKKLSSLKYLSLQGNLLKKLPRGIGGLDILKKLNLSNNLISKLPKSIKKLRSLEYLNLSNNLIKKVPKSLRKLHSLKYLNLKNNPLKNIPSFIYSLENLEKIVF